MIAVKERNGRSTINAEPTHYNQIRTNNRDTYIHIKKRKQRYKYNATESGYRSSVAKK